MWRAGEGTGKFGVGVGVSVGAGDSGLGPRVASPTIGETLEFAQGVGLDFIMLSEHNTNSGGTLYSPIGMPTTMVFAEQLSVDAIIEGVRSGRTVVKVNSIDDPMLETTLSGERMGNTVFADTATLSVVVTEGEDRYRHQIVLGFDAQTIGSYVWLRAADGTGTPDGGVPDGGTDPGESSSGCSCRIASASDYDTGFVWAVLAFGVWYWRRRRAS